MDKSTIEEYVKNNITTIISSIGIILSSWTLAHTLRKDVKEHKRTKNLVTIDMNTNFLKRTVPKIEKYNQQYEKLISTKINKIIKKDNIPESIITQNTTLYNKIKYEASINSKITLILNDLETMAQYSLYQIINNKVFYKTTYPKIKNFYNQNKKTIVIINNKKQTYNSLNQLYAKQWILTIKWGKWQKIKKILTRKGENKNGK